MIVIAIIFWFLISMVIALLIVLDRQREDLAYRQVFLWFISPLTIIAGLVFLDRRSKKMYYDRMKRHLFIK